MHVKIIPVKSLLLKFLFVTFLLTRKRQREKEKGRGRKKKVERGTKGRNMYIH